MGGLQGYFAGTDWLYQVVNGAFLLLVGAWVGAVVVMATMVAPTAFRRLQREAAGALVGGMVNRLQATGVAIALLAFLFSLWRALGWEQANGANFVLRSAGLLGVAACCLVAATVVNPRASRLREALGPDWSTLTQPDDPRRVAFRAAHGWSTRLLMLSALLAVYTIVVQ